MLKAILIVQRNMDNVSGGKKTLVLPTMCLVKKDYCRYSNYSSLKNTLNEGAVRAKGAAYSNNNCQPHNEHC